MHKNGLFTTDETAGMVNIPADTMRRYVRIFPEHFTEQARKERGRRYIGADVQTCCWSGPCTRTGSRQIFISGRNCGLPLVHQEGCYDSRSNQSHPNTSR